MAVRREQKDVVAGSKYSVTGRNAGVPITATHEAWRYARDLAADLDPPDAVYVMDVCETDHGLRLLELNPFSCDRAAVVSAVDAWFG